MSASDLELLLHIGDEVESIFSFTLNKSKEEVLAIEFYPEPSKEVTRSSVKPARD